MSNVQATRPEGLGGVPPQNPASLQQNVRSAANNGTDSTAPEKKNPASLSMDPNAKSKVKRHEPHVKPPFIDVSMGRFLTYLTLGLLLLMAFYTWRMTVWAHDVGGYWNLMTGKRDTPAEVAQRAAESAAAGAASGAASAENKAKAADRGSTRKEGKGTEDTVEGLVFRLADKLGVKPAEINAVIRPLVDPSAPQPTASEQPSEEEQPGLLGVFGEALLD